MRTLTLSFRRAQHPAATKPAHGSPIALPTRIWNCTAADWLIRSKRGSAAGLPGGLYGVALGRMFYGESMFSRVPDASKIALAALVRVMRTERVRVIDCQQNTRHLASLGAREISRREFVAHLKDRCERRQ